MKNFVFLAFFCVLTSSASPVSLQEFPASYYMQRGKSIAEKAASKKIDNVVFDRNGYLFHGKIKAFVDAATENGLKFRRSENV